MENNFSLDGQKIAIVGAGKFAWSLGYALKKNEYKLEAIYSKSIESAQTLAEHLHTHKFDSITKSVNLNTNVWMLTVKDSAIEEVASYMAERFTNLEGHLFVHFSGGKTIAALEPLRKAGAKIASMHVMQTFPSKTPIELSGNFAVIESNEKEISDALSEFALTLGLSPYNLNSFEKIFYHLGGVFSSNFINATFANAKLCENQIKSEILSFNDLLYPIAQQTIENIKEKGIEKSISGPVQRGDLEVVVQHLKTLKPLVKKEYKFALLYLSYISQSLVLLETKTTKTPNDAKIKAILTKELKNLTSSGIID